MEQVRFHGRGGQGVVTAAELLAVAAFLDGSFAQALPSFGSERTGAPVTASCRISDAPIRLRSAVAEPDIVVVQDPTLLADPTLLNGLSRRGTVLINTARPAAEIVSRLAPPEGWAGRLVTIPATDIAQRHLGRPLPNAALLGALSACTGVVTIQSLAAAIVRRFPPDLAERNRQAATEAMAGCAGDLARA